MAHPKLALFGFSKQQSVESEIVQNLFNMVPVTVECGEENQNIVKIHYDKQIDKVPEDVIDKMLKRGWALHRPKGLTRHSKCPKCIRNAIFHSELRRIHSKLYLSRRFSLVNILPVRSP